VSFAPAPTPQVNGLTQQQILQAIQNWLTPGGVATQGAQAGSAMRNVLDNGITVSVPHVDPTPWLIGFFGAALVLVGALGFILPAASATPEGAAANAITKGKTT